MQRIGRYIIRGLLGRGGMARVYKVTLPMIDKTAALKLLDPDPLLAKLMGPQKLRDLFISEARTMAALNHPNIVAIHDFDLAQGRPFYVMDFFANNLGAMIGESYRIEKPSRTIPTEKALIYTRQTLNGLACLHDAGIIHRDIKPFNLLVTARDTVKVCDFGLSKLRGETFRGPDNLNVGSPYYAAPEQEKNPDTVDPSADLYAVGVMFHRMLTGLLPAADPQSRDYHPPSRLNADLDDAWDRFAAKAVAFRPEQRFPSAAAMLGALDALETHWQERKEQTCAVAPPAAPLDHARASGPPRSLPVKAPPKEAEAVFNLDRLWRPSGYIRNDFKAAPGGVVEDRATGLVWQRSGSAFPRDWQAAREYIRRLQGEQFGGRRGWRLPTVNELITLLKPAPRIQDLCVAPVFDATQRWIWSADRRSFVAAYYVDTTLGFVGWQDFSAPFYVRAVCSS
jgi:serine/threonine protein kinase